jgi:hypothetical protein
MFALGAMEAGNNQNGHGEAFEAGNVGLNIDESRPFVY